MGIIKLSLYKSYLFFFIMNHLVCELAAGQGFGRCDVPHYNIHFFIYEPAQGELTQIPYTPFLVIRRPPYPPPGGRRSLLRNNLSGGYVYVNLSSLGNLFQSASGRPGAQIFGRPLGPAVPLADYFLSLKDSYKHNLSTSSKFFIKLTSPSLTPPLREGDNI